MPALMKSIVDGEALELQRNTASLSADSEELHYFRSYGRPSVFAPATEDVAVLEVAGVNVPEGLILPEQKAYFCTLAWCESGSFTMDGRGWSIEVKAGEVGVLNTGQHFSVSAGKEGTKGYYLLMDGSKCEQLLIKSNLWQGVFRHSQIPKQWLEWLAVGVEQNNRQIAVAHTGHLVFKLAGQQAQETFSNPFLWKSCQYIQEHWGDSELNVESVLAYVGVSRSKLSGLFKEHLGMSPLHYLNVIRLSNARQFLAEGEKPISEIVETCGLRDASHFSRWFKKQTGMAPSQFRGSK
jgi:AraC-like DNA-binding protein